MTLSTRFSQDFEVEVQVRSFKLKFGQYFAAAEATKLNLGQDSEARFGQDFKLKFSRNTGVWLRILMLMLNRDSEIET